LYLLVEENKRPRANQDARPQLVAEAVAAFQENNRMRARHRKPKIQEQIIPGIMMIGTSPTFYKIRVTERLSDAISRGDYPEEKTTI
ncbi:hypothetical protein M405DRAFT_687501, partial [Rhizopogon salebrosus TDB-379]